MPAPLTQIQPIYDALGEARKIINSLEIPDNCGVYAGTLNDVEVTKLVYTAQSSLLKARVRLADAYPELT